jgi:PAS domain S-box-containing protein
MDRSRTVLDCIEDAVFVHDAATGAILEVNAAAERMFGYAAEEWGGVDVATGSGDEPAYSEAEALRLIRAAAAGAPQLVEWHSRRRDGTLFWSEVNLRGARVDGAERVLVVVRDITERKRAEESLRREQAFTERVVDAIPGIFFVFDRDGRYVRWNKAHEMLFGMSKGRILDTEALSRIHPEDRARVAATIRQIHETGAGEVEARGLVGPGPETRHFYLTGRRLDIDGAPYVIGFGIDITARCDAEAAKARLEEQLLRAQRLESLGRLAGGIAHDFNNLLTVINGYCDLLLLDGEPDPAALHRDLALVRQAGERAAALTQQLLAFSRKQVAQLQPIAIEAAVSEVVELSRRVIGENIELIVETDPDSGQVLADLAQLHQMLMNLVINARDAMPGGGTLSIRTRAVNLAPEGAAQLDLVPGDYVRLTVADSGSGMAEHVRQHVFDPFFTTKPAGQGTGLGLSTVYGIVRSLHGAIAVESRLGAGSVFEIHLPRFCSEQAAAAPAPAPAAVVRVAGTILVVEDELAVRQFAVEVLTTAGHQVLQAANAEEALLVAAHYSLPIHLLLTDMVMPGLNGRELAGRIGPLHPEARILLVSGYSEILTGDGALDADFHYLQKPYTPETLTRTVERILDATGQVTC